MNCNDCGFKVYNGYCVNCHEETYIYDQDCTNDVQVQFSREFQEKLVANDIAANLNKLKEKEI